MSRTAEIRALVRSDPQRAAEKLAQLLAELFAFQAYDIRLNNDQYSLNSLNGTFDTADGSFFFKFHQEEGEEAMTGEYYRADILAQAGLPVDQPLHMSALPGEQILIYRKRSDPRFSDQLRQHEFDQSGQAFDLALQAERDLCRSLLKVYLKTLHPITADQAAAEPIHRLFHDRMIDPQTRRVPGGRLADFYIDKVFEFPSLTLDWKQFSRLTFVVNGVTYAHSVGALFAAATERLTPSRLADSGGVVAHGDAHNANVWYSEENGRARLSFFDPAFAGAHVPTLLSEVKPTFHNIFAHPFWLYEPAEATRRFTAEARLSGDKLMIDTDWRPTPIRAALLRVKATALWRPLLQELARRHLLPADWQTVIRLGLFLSPTLVMNLRAGAATHTPCSSLIGFATAVMVGSPPVAGRDLVTEFFGLASPGGDPH
jgi:hypothetical protein